MKRNCLLIVCMALVSGLKAQTIFLSKVKIEFERTINVHNQMKETDKDWYERMKDNIPQNNISYFDFIAADNKSIYKPGREVRANNNMMFAGRSIDDITYTDYASGTSISQKPVFDETFLVSDSLTKIKWKITADTREIAGFQCRKAVGILYDTIGIFAFYTDEIMISGGPEGVTGLPGMILGLAVPKLHTTWFATKVEVNGLPLKEIVPEKKGKKVTRTEMLDMVTKVIDDWGNFSSMIRVMLVI